MDTVAAIVTALATIGIAIGAWVQLPLVGTQVRELASQIRLSIQAEKDAEKRTREWETMKICQKYHFDPVIEAACQRIWTASASGTDYTKAQVNHRDVICVLNYLDGIAVGIHQKLYIEQIVQEHLGNIFKHHVEKFISSGVISKDSYDSLMSMYTAWYTPALPAVYDATKSISV